ncbi:MAG TPA: PqqD family peptide modification chaperone [Candidatus Acidoferrales bacterium]|nr:PqqD family peptide modification chaperone [Candidatus Acidoferrales bacterium]
MEAPLSLGSIVVATADQVSCSLGDEAAILNMKNSVYYGVNPVGARVWTLLREPRRVQELRDALLDEYEVEASRCERDLFDLLENMRREGLIELRDAAPEEATKR